MTEPRNAFERRAEASEQVEGQGRSLLQQPYLSGRRLLLAFSFIVLSAVLAEAVGRTGGGTLLRSIVAGLGTGAAVAALTVRRRKGRK